jgi:hypothetical protein
MAASDPCHWGGPVVVFREGWWHLDDLVAGLARIAFESLVGLFTEGIACRVDKQCVCGGTPCTEARRQNHCAEG